MSARIFLGLDYQVTESDLLEKFEQWGSIKEIFIPKDFRGRCKGYAFIEYENASDCAAAVEGADRSQMFGRTLRIEPATGSRKEPGSFRERREPGEDRPPRREFRDRGDRQFRDRGDRGESRSSGGFREFSTLRPASMGALMAVGRRPVQLTQVNALVGRRMFGLAASVVLRRRLV